MQKRKKHDSVTKPLEEAESSVANTASAVVGVGATTAALGAVSHIV